MEKQKLVDLGVCFQVKETAVCFGIGISQLWWKVSLAWHHIHHAHNSSSLRTTTALFWFMWMTYLQLDAETLSWTNLSNAWVRNMRCRRRSWKNLVMNYNFWNVAWFCSMTIDLRYRRITNTLSRCASSWDWIKKCRERKLQDMLTWTRVTTQMSWVLS